MEFVFTDNPLNYSTNIHDDLPENWRTGKDFLESFIVAAALELQERSRVNPFEPFANSVQSKIDYKFRYDSFAHLLDAGPDHYLRTLPWQSAHPTKGTFELSSIGENIGRFTLIGLVWLLIDEYSTKKAGYWVTDVNTRLNAYNRIIDTVERSYFGLHGSHLISAGLQRAWICQYIDDCREISPLEEAFIRGEELYVRGGSLAPDGRLYVDSIWNLAFRLIEARSPEHYLQKYQHRVAGVDDVLIRGGERGVQQLLPLWPGFPA